MLTRTVGKVAHEEAQPPKLSKAEEEDLFGPELVAPTSGKRKWGLLDFTSSAPKHPLKLINAATGETTRVIVPDRQAKAAAIQEAKKDDLERAVSIREPR